MPDDQHSPVIRLAAAGDLLLAHDACGASSRDPARLFAGLATVLQDRDVVLGNLECTLPGSGRVAPREPRVIATPEMVRAVAAAGFNVVSLANNHTFDCLQEGFHSLRALLSELGVACFGAGDDLQQASAPAVLEVNGLRLAFLGAADRRSGATEFADTGRWGVAPLAVEALAEQVRNLRPQVDHVIVSLHWGEERLLIPAPEQVAAARRLAEAGASLVLGHHPHVIQGLEIHAGVPIIYSLGNLAACDVPYADGDVLTWDHTERTGCLLLAELNGRGVSDLRQLATHDDGAGVKLDSSGFGRRRLARANRALARGITLGRYRREYFWVKTVRPILQHLRPSNLRSLRLRQVGKALALAARSRRAQ